MNMPTPEARAARIDGLFAGTRVLPVLTIAEIDDAVPLARALVSGGLRVFEVTLRTPVALDAIACITRALPQATVGVGTVLGASDLDAAARAGAAFAIAPGATAALYAAAAHAAIPLLPAVATASEIMTGIEQGHRRFKFFPAAASGGTAALRGFAGPFAEVRFCPTGGIDRASAAGYLAVPNVFAVGGSWMLPEAALAARDWQAIAALAAEAAALR